MKTSMSEFRSQQHHIVSLLATSFCFMAIFLCLPQKVSAQAVGGIPLGSTTDWPIRPALLPFAYANLCQKPNDTGSGQEWRVSTDSIALGVPSVELFGSSQLQEILIIQHCAPAALSPGTFASPHDTFPSLAPISATLPFTALAPLTLANSGMVTSVGILTRSVALPSYPVPVNTMPRLPIGVLEPLLRGVTLVSRDQLPPFTDWKPITDTRLILIHPDGQSESIQPREQPDTWEHAFPLDSPSGFYTLTIQTAQNVVTTTQIHVRKSERVFLRGAEDQLITTTFAAPEMVEIDYYDFDPGRPVHVALYRNVPAPATELPHISSNKGMLAPIATFTISTTTDMTYTHKLTEVLSLPSSAKVSGMYVILACYEDACNPQPFVHLSYMHTVKSVDWPQLFFTSFVIGDDPVWPLTGFGSELQVNEFSDTGDPTTISVPETGLVHNTPGLASVEYVIADERGVVVHQRVDDSPPFCLFGEEASIETGCRSLDFSVSGKRWPSGEQARSSYHTLRITGAFTNGNTAVTERTFLVQLPDISASVVRTDEHGASSFVSGALVFQVEAYDSVIGNFDGAGISEVELSLLSPRGERMLLVRDPVAPYCLFDSMPADANCAIWRFSEHGYSWPNGEAVQNGIYILTAVVRTTDGSSKVVNREVRIQID